MAALLVAAMVGLAFASVPLYRLFCQVTGFGGTPMRADEVAGSLAPTGKLIRVRFDANTNSALPWQFQPERKVEKVAIGAREMAFYTARNLGTEPVTGTATFNVTPAKAGNISARSSASASTSRRSSPARRCGCPSSTSSIPRSSTIPMRAGSRRSP
jgi:cytochrome c oxidase assembly protein subunit 11